MPDTLTFANNAVSVVGHDLLPGATVVQLPLGHGDMFPSTAGSDVFRVTLEDRRVKPVLREIATCINRSGDTLVLRRAQENTTAKTFSAGFVCSNRMTAGALNAVVKGVLNLSALWLGVHAVPPTTSLDGGPIPEGALYYNSLTEQLYTWDGSEWRSLMVPQQALTVRLFYIAEGGETSFGNETDIYGHTLNLNTVDEQPVMYYLNGELQWLDDGSGTTGEYTVDWINNKIDLVTPAVAGELIELDQLVPADRLAPTVTDLHGLRDIDLHPVTGAPGYIDGTRTTFPLKDQIGGTVTTNDPFMLNIYLDGVQQQHGVDFTVASDLMTFLSPPPAGTVFWGTYFGTKGGTIITLPIASEPGQVVIAGEDLNPKWSDVIDEGVYS